METKRNINVTPMFEDVFNDHQEIIVDANNHTYIPNGDYKNDWLYFMLLGAKAIRGKKKVKINKLLSIGSGNGIDLIGLNKVFGTTNIWGTDINEEVLDVIKENVLKYITPETNVNIVKSDIFDNPVFDGEKFDLIYENLPNIPVNLIGKELTNGINSSSYISIDSVNNNYFSNYLLDLHYRFLEQCEYYMSRDSAAICNIGIRFPLSVYQKLFDQFSYRHEILVAGLKIQTEAMDVIKGYQRAEKQFDDSHFHYYAVDKIPDKLLNKRLILPGKRELSEFLSKIKPFQIDIATARGLAAKGQHVAHLVITTGIYN